MDFKQAQDIWHDWQNKKMPTGELHLASDIAASFISSFQQREPEDLRLIDLLCEMAMAKQAKIAKHASATLFSEIIEILCDDFSKEGVATCAHVLLRILDSIRKQPEGRELDSLLRKKGLNTTAQLLERFEAIREKTRIPEGQLRKTQKIIILSRVTAGADISITGIIIQRLRKSFPQAEFILIGPEHLPHMFGQAKRCRSIPFIYKNNGSLLEKMTTWPALLAIVTKESHDFYPGEVLLFDPDTRLSQLGLLPLLDDEHTWYFPSRTIGLTDGRQKSLSELSNQWLNEILGENKPPLAYPLLSVLEEQYSAIRNSLKNEHTFIITINFGVGNDPRKKIGAHFELTLLHELLKTPQTVIILDNGCGDEEHKRTEHHLQVLKQFGFNTQTITKGENIEKISLHHGIISHQGPLCDLGKWIKISDCFIGYDSCGQHIANAAGTPSVITFAGAPSARFVARWSPNNKTGSTFPIYRHSKLGKRELDTLLKNVVEAVAKVRKN